MAPARPTALDLLRATLDDEAALRAKGRELGVVRRHGKIDVYALLATVILGVALRGPTVIAQLGHLLSRVTGKRLARSSVWARFTPAFRDLVQHVLDRQVQRARAQPSRPPGVLGVFRDVIAVDATVVKVRDDLAGVWKGTRTNTAVAALKVHTWVRAFTGELLKYKITPDAYGDGRAFGVDHDLRGCLVLFDKAYSSPSLWRRVDNVGGYFLTRLPKNRDPMIESVLRRHRGRARKLAGRPLRDALAGLQRQIVDIEARFRCRVRKYDRSTNRWVVETFRLVAIRNRRGHYEVFVTNAPPEMLPAEIIARVYRLRWEVETFYKSAKSGSGLNEQSSTKPHIVETLVYAALLRATASMQALSGFRTEVSHPLGRAINPGQWQRWWNLQLHGVLAGLIHHNNHLTVQELARLLADPNVGRPTNRWTFFSEGFA